MVFCFEEMTIEDIQKEYSGIVSQNDILVLAKSVAGRVDLPKELKGKSDMILRLAKFSLQKQITLLANIEACIGEKVYDSVIVIDKGKILGVSDCINSEDKAIKGGNALRCYMTSMGRICVFVGGDICFPELWSFAEGSRYIISLIDRHIDSVIISSAKALAVYLGKYVLICGNTTKICINPYGKIESIKNGRMTAFYLPMSLALGKKLGKRIQFVEE